MKINKPAIIGRESRNSLMRSRDEEGEEGGDAGELAPGRTFSFSKIVITRKQAQWLIGNDLVFQALFDTSKRIAEPLPEVNISTIKLSTKYKGCHAVIRFGVKADEVSLENARVSGITLERITGGFQIKRMSVQGLRPRSMALHDLDEFYGKEVNLELKFGEADEHDEDADEAQVDFVAEQQREAGQTDDAETVVPATGGTRPAMGATH